MIQKGGKATIRNRQTAQNVGSLYDRESCLFYFDDGDGSIGYLASDGTFKTYVPADMNLLNLKECIEYPYSTAYLNPNSPHTLYYIFKIRNTTPVYAPDGETVWGTVAAGQYVATTNSEMGQTKKTWKEINYVKSTSGQWVQVSGSGYSHGYVPTRIENSSGYSSINFYGSW